MPYRRLPNTDQARLKSLRLAVQRAKEQSYEYSGEIVLDYKMQMRAERALQQLEDAVAQFQTVYSDKVAANKQYQKAVRLTRMYISHFIQVLDMAVQRGELKKEIKALYKLDVQGHSLPNLARDEQLLEWGKNLIEGEQERTHQGGQPITWPSINKLKWYYDAFADQQRYQAQHKKNTKDVSKSIEQLRREIDELLVELWDSIEAHFEDKLPYERMCACERYGMIFYYRPDEKRITAETDARIREYERQQLKLDFNSHE